MSRLLRLAAAVAALGMAVTCGGDPAAPADESQRRVEAETRGDLLECPECHQYSLPTAVFCNHCGTRIRGG